MGYVVDALTYLSQHPSLIVAGFLLYGFIFLLSLLFTSPKPGPNPFRRKLQPPAPLVTDQGTRDAVLKQGFTSKRVPDKVDAIIVGSGIGGLAAGVMLSKAGKRVLVLEQHDQAGGCCHSYEEKGFEFDVGIHYIGQMRNNSVAKVLVDQVTEGQLVWEHLIDEFDVVALGQPGKQKFYPFNAGGRDPWKARMLKNFPGEEKAIDKYLQLLKEVRENMMGPIMLKFMNKHLAKFLVKTGLINLMTRYFSLARRSLQSVVEELTDNKDLQAVLCYSFGDYGAVPSEASFAMHAALINHYLYGASYPRGGASEIAFHTIPIIERAGGKVLVRAQVSKLLTKNGAVTGVRVERTGGAVDIQAPLVISDAGVLNTFHKLLPKEVAIQSDIYKLLGNQVDSGVGCMSLFVGLKGTTEELGLKPQNIWAFTGNDISGMAEKYLAMSRDDAAEAEVPLIFISFPSSKDSTYNDRYPGKSACTVVTLANWSWFEEWEDERVKKRGKDYDAIKNGIGRRMWEQTVAIYPQLADKVEYFEVGTPITNSHYIASPKGEIYGLDHTAKRFGSPEIVSTLRPDTGIKGLLLTGQDVFSCGFLGAMFGGVLCASKVLNRNLWDDLVKVKAELKKAK